MSEVWIHCLRKDQSIDEVFSIEGPHLEDFMFHLVMDDMCPLKNYICKFGYDYIKYLNIYYENELHYKVTLDEDYHSQMGKGSLLVKSVKEKIPYLH